MKRFLLALPLLTAPSVAQEPSPYTRSGLAAASYPVASKLKDKTAFGGFAPSENFSRPLGKIKAPANQVSIVLGELVRDAKRKINSREVFVVNRTGKTIEFGAQDSSLAMVQEARDARGTWRPIEERFDSFCGNSYHRVFLESNRMWRLLAPIYSGDFRTQLRFSLRQDKTTILSPAFAGKISLGHFAPKAFAAQNLRPKPTEVSVIRPSLTQEKTPKVLQLPAPKTQTN